MIVILVLNCVIDLVLQDDVFIPDGIKELSVKNSKAHKQAVLKLSGIYRWNFQGILQRRAYQIPNWS